uniref:Intracellular protein transport protein USO1 n=1 Tax=Anthurium amnicola TaxID=1678845 RepID=A0A1D1ZJ43_9ARAE
MEEDTQASSGEVQVKSLNTKIEEVKKEDDEETALEKEFIKVEKESIDVKDNSVNCKTTTAVEACPPEVKSMNSAPNTELVEAQEKIKLLKNELGTLVHELQSAESEKAQFQVEVSIANEKLQQSNKHCEELENDLKRLKEEMVEAGLKHQSQCESLQDALGTQEAKHKELLGVKKAFDELSLELECSREKVGNLEQDLSSSTEELRKFEELSNERGLHADSQSKNALELEKKLEVANLSVREVETQMVLMQEELKGLYNKVTQSQHAEEALSKTRSRLSEVHEELELSKSRVAELEQKVAYDGASIQELTEELNQRKASEDRLTENLIAVGNLLSDSKEALQTKEANLENIELSLQEELKRRESIEANLKTQELQILSLQEELVRASKDKETFEVAIGELNGNLLQFKERCSDLESKLYLSDQSLSKTDSLLSESLSHNAELLQKLKSLEEQQQEYGAVADMLNQKNTVLEDSLKASNYVLEEVKAQLTETEKRLASVEERNEKLEQQLNLSELKCSDKDREINELRDKTFKLSDLLKASEEENSMSRCHFQGYQDRMSQLESSLEKSSLRKTELEKELTQLLEKCTEHESQSTSAQNRSLELEELIQVAHSKVENSGNRVGELEVLLETTNYRVLELEGQLSSRELKLKDGEAELQHKCGQVSELSAELEAFQVKSSSLELALEAANNKEKELVDLLNAATEEKKKFEDLSKTSGEKLSEAENLIDVLQVELNSAKQNLQNVVKDLEVSAVREMEILEKLNSAEEQLEHQGKEVEKATTRSCELESLHESLSKDSELKLQEAILNCNQKDSEAKELHAKLKSLEEQAAFYQDQAAEAREKLAILKAEMEKSSNNVISLESILEELKTKLLDTEKRSEQSFSENELLAETNMKLKEELEACQHKINELHDILNSVHAEKDTAAEQLTSHVKTLTELRDQHSKVLELQSETEFRKRETDGQLNEALERLTQRDSEAKGLGDKLNELGCQVRSYEEQLREAAAVTEVQKAKLDEYLSKLRILEGTVEEAKSKSSQLEASNECLAEANMKLTQELAAYETKTNDLQTTMDSILAEKEKTFGELHLVKKTNEDFVQNLASEGERLQSQISSLTEEKILINQMYQEAQKEIQTVLAQMEEQLKEQQAKEHSLNVNVETLTAELKVKSEMQAQVAELEHKLLSSETRFREEIESIRVVSAEKEAVLTSKLEEHSSSLKEKDVLYEQLEQLKSELNLSHTTIMEQRDVDTRKDLEREAAIKQSLTEVEAKHQHAIILEKQVEELKQKLQQSEERCIEKDEEESKRLALLNAELDDLRMKLTQTAELEKKIVDLENKLQLAHNKSDQYKGKSADTEAKDGVDVKSRDIGPFTTPLKRKSKKRSEGYNPSSGATSPNQATTTAEPTGAMALKFILGVAVVSIIIGIILGKRY